MIHSPIMPSYLLPEPSQYQNYPDRIILDLEEEIKAFYDAIAPIADYDKGACDDVLSMVVQYLIDYEEAVKGLHALHAEIIHTWDGRFSKDAERLADATFQLGLLFLQRLKRYGIYTQQGLLPYELKDTQNWPNHYSPVLYKFTEEY